jgi:hypothetical protein
MMVDNNSRRERSICMVYMVYNDENIDKAYSTYSLCMDSCFRGTGMVCSSHNFYRVNSNYCV